MLFLGRVCNWLSCRGGGGGGCNPVLSLVHLLSRCGVYVRWWRGGGGGGGGSNPVLSLDLSPCLERGVCCDGTFKSGAVIGSPNALGLVYE